ncbi:MAG: hypothetical protein NUW23_03045 [Firmicutes bacterium]|nr:hypothetical protein [Bacillota bacterium]
MSKRRYRTRHSRAHELIPARMGSVLACTTYILTVRAVSEAK